MSNARLFGVMADEKKFETPLVFVHGAWLGAWCWDEHFMAWFADQGFDVFALQLRGHGAGASLANFKYPGIQDYLKDLVRAVDHLDTNPVFIGHSMGAHLLQHYAQKFHAEAMVMCTPVPPSGIYKMAMRFAMKHPFESGLLNMNLLVPPMDVIPRSAKNLLFSEELEDEKAFAYLSKMHAESPRVFMDMAYPVDTKKTHSATKVVVLGAEQDSIVHADEVRETAEAYGVRAEFMDGAHHLFMLDKNWEAHARTILAKVKEVVKKDSPVS